MALRSCELTADQLWYLSLCAGFGGLDLGLRIAEPRARAVGYVERDAYAASALVARMDDAALDCAPIWDDLKSFDGRAWRGVVDLLVAGYPCQPFSTSGKKLGAADPRHLWPHVARVIRDARPRGVFLENVEGHVALGLAEVGSDLRRMGYRAKAGLFSAAETGAPHWRKRLFVLAYADCAALGKSSPDQDYGPGHDRRNHPRDRGQSGRSEGRGLHLQRDGHVPPRDRRLAGRAIDHRALPIFPPAPGDLPAWSRTLAERPELEPAVLRMADGVDDWLDRCRGAGNGVVPLAAALAYRTLKADFGLA